MFIGLNHAPERTGIAPYTAGMAARLAARGDDVRVLTTFPHYPEWRFVQGGPPRRDVVVEQGVEVVRLRHRLPRRGSSVSRVLSELSFGLRALTAAWSAPDAVVLVSPALFANVLLVPRLLLRRTPFVLWVQDLYGPGVRETGRGDAGGLLAGAVTRLETWTLRRATRVIAIHEQMARTIVGLGVRPDRVEVVRNWSHLPVVAPVDRKAVRERFGWSPDRTMVVHTGNMGQKQDLENVVEAARVVQRTGADIRFVLVGDGVDRPALERSSRGLDALEMMPPIAADQYQGLLEAADVLLVNEHPGMRDMALPSKLTSYFSSGRPVLAATSADSATAAELSRSAAGDRVDPGRPAELVRAVQRLVADPDRMSQLAAAGLRYRRTALTPEGAGEEFERVLGSLASPGDPVAHASVSTGADSAARH